MDKGISPVTGKKEATSAGRFMGWNTIHDKAGNGSKYMTRIWVGRLRFHIFYRGDLDEDCHDHPWDFWTFPLTSYVEEVAERIEDRIYLGHGDFEIVERIEKRRQIVPAFRFSFRPAEHCHRVLGAWSGRWEKPYPGRPLGSEMVWSYRGKRASSHIFTPQVDYRKKIVTIVWRSKPKRTWGFLKNRDGKWCWVVWREYVFGEGKSAPCE